MPHTDDYDRDLELTRRMAIENEQNRKGIKFILGLFLIIVISALLFGLASGFINF